MNIAVSYAKLDPNFNGIAALKAIENAGRISHRSEDLIIYESYLRFIKAVVLEHGDWSIVEHVSVSVEFYVDRGITHELVRHRLFGFTQESTRFVNYTKKQEPYFIRPNFKNEVSEYLWWYAINEAEKAYQMLISLRETPQMARSVFPNALASKILITGNLRNWRHFLLMRTTKESHPQMREVTIPLLAQFKAAIPLL